MAKVFNRIRKNLLANKKILGYLSYAFGEIILVVIGILIALQIDQLVQDSADNNAVNAFEVRLFKEVQSNIKILNRKMKNLEIRADASSQIIQMIGDNYQDKNPRRLDSLLGTVLHFNNIRLGYGALNEGIGNGELDLITEDSLRTVLYELPVHIEAVKKNEELYNNDYYNTIIPYLNKNYSRRNIDGFSERYKTIIGTTALANNDNLHVLGQKEFENHIRNLLFLNLSLKDHYRGLRRRYMRFEKILQVQLDKQ
ncbi:MAG: hypothetical protein ABJM06_06335 [Gilvibacter sp.]